MPRSVKSCPLPDFPAHRRGQPGGQPPARAGRAAADDRRPPTAWTTRLSSRACRPAPSAAEAGPIDGERRLPVELQRSDRRLRPGALAAARPPLSSAGIDGASGSRPRRRARSKREVDVRGSSIHGTPRAIERRGQPRPRHREQRPQQPHVRPFDQRRHAGKAIEAAAARRAHGHGLGLVVGVMGKQQMQDAAAPAFAATTADSARSARPACRPLRGLASGPAQDVRLDAEPRQQVARVGGFLRRRRRAGHDRRSGRRCARRAPRAQSCASSASASESRPPDTATATTGCVSNGSNGGISRANAPAIDGPASAGVTRSRSSGAPARPAASAGRWRADSPGRSARRSRRRRACGRASPA